MLVINITLGSGIHYSQRQGRDDIQTGAGQSMHCLVEATKSRNQIPLSRRRTGALVTVAANKPGVFKSSGHGERGTGKELRRGKRAGSWSCPSSQGQKCKNTATKRKSIARGRMDARTTLKVHTSGSAPDSRRVMWCMSNECAVRPCPSKFNPSLRD